ncbi:MAG TPA: hypothetical protein VMK12_28450, partial [Anaeromyxobacteraceae bacterium]|nr:hypothetical protein [Anaeromyxobacteraceae bacterium]
MDEIDDQRNVLPKTAALGRAHAGDLVTIPVHQDHPAPSMLRVAPASFVEHVARDRLRGLLHARPHTPVACAWPRLRSAVRLRRRLWPSSDGEATRLRVEGTLPTRLAGSALHQLLSPLVYWSGRPLHVVLAAGGQAGWCEVVVDALAWHSGAARHHR